MHPLEPRIIQFLNTKNAFISGVRRFEHRDHTLEVLAEVDEGGARVFNLQLHWGTIEAVLDERVPEDGIGRGVFIQLEGTPHYRIDLDDHYRSERNFLDVRGMYSEMGELQEVNIMSAQKSFSAFGGDIADTVQNVRAKIVSGQPQDEHVTNNNGVILPPENQFMTYAIETQGKNLLVTLKDVGHTENYDFVLPLYDAPLHRKLDDVMAHFGFTYRGMN